MKTFLALCAFVLAPLVCACATAPPADFRFDASAGKSMLAVSLGTGMATTWYKFRPVNLQTGEFIGEEYVILRFPSADRTTLQSASGLPFGLREVPPGDYALVVVEGFASSGITETSGYRCYPTGAPVFSVAEGKIVVVEGPIGDGTEFSARATGAPAASERTLREFENARSTFPGLSAPVAAAPQVALITYSETENRDSSMVTGAPCPRPRSFQVVRR